MNLGNPRQHVIARNTFPESGVVDRPTFVNKDVEKAPVNALLRTPASVATHIRWDAFKGEGATGPILFPHELKHDMGIHNVPTWRTNASLAIPACVPGCIHIVGATVGHQRRTGM